MEIKELLDGIKADLENQMTTKAKEAANGAFELKFADVANQLKELEKTATKDELLEIKSFAQGIKDSLEKLDVAFQKGEAGSKKMETKSFNEALAETIEANAASIKSFALDQKNRMSAGSEFGMDLELKAVGDMSMANNFPGGSVFSQDVRQSPIINPYERLWIGDLLPSGSSNASQLVYPQDNGGEGAAALWKESDNKDKPQVDFDLKSVTVAFQWIAAYLVVDRSMLDDISWLTSYLQNKLLISLKTAENDYLLNDTTSGLIAKATAYSGSYTNSVDRIVDAAYGQVTEDTMDMYAANLAIMRPRNAVGLGLNKASTSGVYDLPGGVSFQNGRLNIGGINVAPTTSIAANQFLTLDTMATQFVKRLQPELRMFEDSTLAKRNKVMFRIEERAALAVYEPKALVKGSLSTTT